MLIKKPILIIVIALMFVSITICMLGCSGNRNKDEEYIDTESDKFFDLTMPSGKAELIYPILHLNEIKSLTFLGQVNPPGHTFPTDHIYFGPDYSKRNDIPIYAPASGRIIYIEKYPDPLVDHTIRVAVTDTFTYYIMHFDLDDNYEVGDMVVAGSQIGVTGSSYYVDFGVYDKDVINYFIRPPVDGKAIHSGKPISYYPEFLRSQLYGLIKPWYDPDYINTQGDGEFAVDKLGSLSGNWFMEGKDFSSWENHLSFSNNVFYPELTTIGIGYADYTFIVINNTVKPEDVTLETGAVLYLFTDEGFLRKGGTIECENELLRENELLQRGYLLVELLTDTRLRIELFDYGFDEPQNFTEKASFYVR